MIFNKLIIYSRNRDEILKEYSFNKVGLNIILGVKVEKAEEGNRVGKTSFIESIRYLLGTRVPKIFKNKDNILKLDVMFILSIIDDNEKIYLGRIVSQESTGYIKRNGDLDFNIDNWEYFKDKQYKEEIEKLFMKNNKIKNPPSFASTKDYLIRDEKSGFNDIVLSRQAIVQYKILDYLFGIDGSSEKEICLLKDKEKELNDKIKVIDSLIGDIATLRVNEKKVKDELEQLVDISKKIEITKNIDISKKDYKKIKKDFNEVNEKILKLESIKEQYKVNIKNLQTTVSRVKELDDVKEFYNEILNYFPEKLVKNYDEALEFYQFMVNSRGRYFRENIEKVTKMILSLEDKKEILKSEIDNQLDTLQSTTVVEDINNILQKISDKNKELSDTTTKIEQYESKDKIISEIDDIKREIISKTNLNREIFQSYKEIITDAQIRFNEIVEKTYNESGSLLIEFNSKTAKRDTTGRIKISCSINDDSSNGRTHMKINMFDLTWLLQRIEYNYPIQFLIHDGSYVKPDNNNAKYRLLSYVDEYLKTKGKGQYVITMNLGELEDKDLDIMDNNNCIIAKLNNEKDENRFMGIKY
ncbi:DUF2326 domain-containing protein [Clostridium botulinum]|nr:DUF2326 domain-containing protein [Clostridium botulinum]